MDPTEALSKIRACMVNLRDIIDEDFDVRNDEVTELLDRVEELDEWICKGGFLPGDWQPS